VATNDYPGVIRVANDLAADFGRVLGTNATVVPVDWNNTASKKSSSPIILLGTIGKSTLIDGLVSSKKLDVSSIVGKREAFTTQAVPKTMGRTGCSLRHRRQRHARVCIWRLRCVRADRSLALAVLAGHAAKEATVRLGTEHALH
jgi:hypothetical protein